MLYCPPPILFLDFLISWWRLCHLCQPNCRIRYDNQQRNCGRVLACAILNGSSQCSRSISLFSSLLHSRLDARSNGGPLPVDMPHKTAPPLDCQSQCLHVIFPFRLGVFNSIRTFRFISLSLQVIAILFAVISTRCSRWIGYCGPAPSWPLWSSWAARTRPERRTRPVPRWHRNTRIGPDKQHRLRLKSVPNEAATRSTSPFPDRTNSKDFCWSLEPALRTTTSANGCRWTMPSWSNARLKMQVYPSLSLLCEFIRMN